MSCNFYLQCGTTGQLCDSRYKGNERLLVILAVVNECDSLLILNNHNCRMINATNSMMNVLQKPKLFYLVIMILSLYDQIQPFRHLIRL
jgi:hypothetical protein